METVTTDDPEVKVQPYRVIVYCPRCTATGFIDLNDYPGYTLEDIHFKMVCSACGAEGMDFSIVQNDTDSPVS